MVEELDHKTFDITAMLAGTLFPTAEVKINLNSEAGAAIDTMVEIVRVAETNGDTERAKEVQEKLDDLVRSLKDTSLTVHIQGIPEYERQNILDKIMKEFPVQKDMYGQEVPNLKRDSEYRKRLWTAMIKKIVNHDGAIAVMDISDIEKLFRYAPSSAHTAINQAIDSLDGKVSAGFEYAAKEVDFLSIA